MAGQLIVLPGVTVAAAAGAPRLSMNAADAAASKIVSLKHVVSARALTALPGGGVSGRCRNTGASLIPKGANASMLSVSTVGGRKGLGQTGGSAGLALPAGSLTNSFCMVAAIYLGGNDTSSSSLVNFLAGFDATDNYIAAPLRYYGQNYSTVPSRADKMVSFGPSTTDFAAEALRTNVGWNIVIIDYDNDQRRLSISVNQSTSFAAVTKSTTASFADTSYLEVGYHLSANRLIDSKVGDLYTFDDSLLKAELGKSQLGDVVQQLKGYYAIT